jgi:hypothetical protein
VQKNKARDEARLAKRKKIVAILFIVGSCLVQFLSSFAFAVRWILAVDLIR